MNLPAQNASALQEQGESANQNSKRSNHTGNSAEAQRARLLVELRKSPVTTLSARRDIDVLHVAARILELRQLGYRIDTIWTSDCTSEGHSHRVAKYVLQGEAEAGHV